jgi:hypothetical protein
LGRFGSGLVWLGQVGSVRVRLGSGLVGSGRRRTKTTTSNDEDSGRHSFLGPTNDGEMRDDDDETQGGSL